MLTTYDKTRQAKTSTVRLLYWMSPRAPLGGSFDGSTSMRREHAPNIGSSLRVAPRRSATQRDAAPRRAPLRNAHNCPSPSSVSPAGEGLSSSACRARTKDSGCGTSAGRPSGACAPVESRGGSQGSGERLSGGPNALGRPPVSYAYSRRPRRNPLARLTADEGSSLSSLRELDTRPNTQRRGRPFLNLFSASAPPPGGAASFFSHPAALVPSGGFYGRGGGVESPPAPHSKRPPYGRENRQVLRRRGSNGGFHHASGEDD